MVPDIGALSDGALTRMESRSGSIGGSDCKAEPADEDSSKPVSAPTALGLFQKGPSQGIERVASASRPPVRPLQHRPADALASTLTLELFRTLLGGRLTHMSG